ncbi:MAG: DUF6265 family protein, partial [Candidatus Thorarchaeota archaeon]
DDVVEEYWLPVLDDKMAGIFRWTKDGEINIYEIIGLSVVDDELHMFLRHFDRKFVAWEEKDKPLCFVVTELSSTDVVFVDKDNPDKGFLRYSLKDDTNLEFISYEQNGEIQFKLEFRKM